VQHAAPDPLDRRHGGLALFVASGGYVAVRGGVAQRLLLFLASAAIVAAYAATLSMSLPMVIETEIGCAADGRR
jgi:uncharacterized membrane protein YccC